MGVRCDEESICDEAVSGRASGSRLIEEAPVVVD